MTTFKLHGMLGKKFGAEWRLCVKSIGEGMRAIIAQTRGLQAYLISKDKQGVQYRVILDDRECECDADVLSPLKAEEVHIIPVVQGHGGSWWKYLLAGVAFIAIAFIPGLAGIALPGGTTVGGLAFSIGIALAFAGISMLLSPKSNFDKDRTSLASSAFNGDVNSAVQGVPVPLAYGGPMMIGSQIINAQVISVDMPLS